MSSSVMESGKPAVSKPIPPMGPKKLRDEIKVKKNSSKPLSSPFSLNGIKIKDINFFYSTIWMTCFSLRLGADKQCQQHSLGAQHVNQHCPAASEIPPSSRAKTGSYSTIERYYYSELYAWDCYTYFNEKVFHIYKTALLESEEDLTVKQKLAVSSQIGSNWRLLGHELAGFSNSQMDQLEEPFRANMQPFDEVIYKMLESWEERSKSRPTVGQLARALKKLKMHSALIALSSKSTVD